MTQSFVRRAFLVAALSAALFWVWRREHPSVPQEARGSDKPINVASVVAGCTELADCDQACAKGQAQACVTAGRLYEFGHDVAADPARAYALYQKACELKYAGGCYNAAFLLAAGKGVAKDPSRARELYARVCEMGSKTACEKAVAVRE